MNPADLVIRDHTLSLQDAMAARATMGRKEWASFCLKRLTDANGLDLVVEGNLRCWLRLLGYGYIAQVAWTGVPLGTGWVLFERGEGLGPVQLRPVNLGFDLDDERDLRPLAAGLVDPR